MNNREKKNKFLKLITKEKWQLWAEVVIIFTAFIIYFSLSCYLPVEKAPDEYMRYDVAEYIFSYHRLPAGYAEEIRNPIWGFSYAFTPYLPSVIAAGLMRIVSFFGGSGTVLIIASRFGNVLAATGCTALAFKIGRKMFSGWDSSLMYTAGIGVLPQFVFLAAYLNNDIPAVFASMLILLSWLVGRERHWDHKSCILLEIGISLCALTYYNAYGWILCSILYFVVTVLRDQTLRQKGKHLVLRGGLIAGVVLLLAGWFFIRNAIIYDGDFLGMKTSLEYGEMYAQEEYKPSNRVTFENEGKSLRAMLDETEWLEDSVDSFFAVFGYMNILVSQKYYDFYRLLLRIGILGFLWGCIRKKAKGNGLLYGCCIACTIIPVVLSAINSYSSDYQAQGRYFMPALPAVMLLVTQGYRWLEDELSFLKLKKRYLTFLVTLAWVAAFGRIFIKVMLPCLYTGI